MSMRVLAVCLIVVCLGCNRLPSPAPQSDPPRTKDATSIEKMKKPSLSQSDPATLVNKIKFQNYEAAIRTGKVVKQGSQSEK
jgi:hypothetical protein